MMIVELEGAVLKVCFRHLKVGPSEWAKNEPAYSHKTVCTIFDITDGQPDDKPWKGVAKCSIKDNFCKEKGRKEAMTRALKEIGLRASEREVVWKTYFARPRLEARSQAPITGLHVG